MQRPIDKEELLIIEKTLFQDKKEQKGISNRNKNLVKSLNKGNKPKVSMHPKIKESFKSFYNGDALSEAADALISKYLKR